MKILILSDNQGWIVDRISNKFKELIPYDIDIDYYTTIEPEDLLRKGLEYDLIHFNNWDIARFANIIPLLECKTLITIRSHRYYPAVKIIADMVDKIHVINEQQLKEFPRAEYIPDGMFVEPRKEFKVGMAFQDNEYNREYKGYNLVKKVCDDLKCSLHNISNLPPNEVPDWLRSLDLYVCASIAEGHSTMVMEALSLNVPVITTRVGVPASMDLDFIERTPESIKAGILRHYTAYGMDKYSWENVCNEMTKLYESIWK